MSFLSRVLGICVFDKKKDKPSYLKYCVADFYYLMSHLFPSKCKEWTHL